MKHSISRRQFLKAAVAAAGACAAGLLSSCGGSSGGSSGGTGASGADTSKYPCCIPASLPP